ncbi:MAG: Sentrin-specific protease 6 [Peltula sp. TS41687]|nr:MAG: Sentrin-specific protease 6 [Peltula sp. TS41687]
MLTHQSYHSEQPSHLATSIPVRKSRPSPGQDEKRLLGDYGIPKDAVPIAVPSNNLPTGGLLSSLRGSFKPMNTLSQGNTSRNSFRTQKVAHPITFSTKKNPRKRSHPQSAMGTTSGRSDKPFDLHMKDVDEPSNKRAKQGLSAQVQDTIELISSASDRSDNQVAASPMAPSQSGSSFTAQTGNKKAFQGHDRSVNEFRRVEDTIRVSGNRAKSLGKSRPPRSPEIMDSFGVEEISSSDDASPRPLEHHQRSLESKADIHGSNTSAIEDYKGTANSRMSRRQMDKLNRVTNGRTHTPVPRHTRSHTKSPWFIPQGDKPNSTPGPSGMRSKGVTGQRQEPIILSPGEEDVRQAPKRTDGAARKPVVLASSDGTHPNEQSRVSSGFGRKTARLQSLQSGHGRHTASVDNPIIALSSDSLEREGKPVGKPEMKSSAPDSVATVGNITPTTFTKSSSVKESATVNSTRKLKIFPNPRFEIKALDIGIENHSASGLNIISDEHSLRYYITIDESSKELNLLSQDAAENQEGQTLIVPFSSIFKLDCSPRDMASSCTLILSTRSITTMGRQGWVWIEFVSYEDRDDFSRYAESLGIKLQRRNDSYMSNWRQNHQSEAQDKSRVINLLRDGEERKKNSNSHSSAWPQNLQEFKYDKDVESRPNRSGVNQTATTAERQGLSVQKSKRAPAIEENPHVTRSRTRQPKPKAAQGSDSDVSTRLVPEVVKYSKTQGLPQRWALPLVYPPEGPRKATVDWIDLERLDEGEFLNDNLISLYLRHVSHGNVDADVLTLSRYLEHKLEESNKIAAQKVYTFNTFFYARLTSEGQSHKGFNFAAVAKWTSKIDIFSYDYVVVPINESAHWYLAIICNLPKLVEKRTHDDSQTAVSVTEQKTSSERRDSDQTSMVVAEEGERMEFDMDQKDGSPVFPELMEMDEPTAVADGDSDTSMKEINEENGTQEPVTGGISPESSLTEIGTGPRGSPINVGSPKTPVPKTPVISVDDIEVVPIATNQPEDDMKVVITSSTQRRKKKPAPGPKKYDVDGPVIITLDSLGLPHSTTIKNLKQYLVEEALSKRQLEIDVKDISGMTAKQIPEQDNFCDCGLFLLGYMAKFFQEPRDLVNKILQRNLNVQKDWPDMVPTKMRSSIRELLINMWNKQEQARRVAKKVEAKRHGKYHGPEKVSSADTKTRQPAKEPVVSIETSPKTSAKPNDVEVLGSKGEDKASVTERPNLQKEDSVIVLSQPTAVDEDASLGGNKNLMKVVIPKKTP